MYSVKNAVVESLRHRHAVDHDASEVDALHSTRADGVRVRHGRRGDNRWRQQLERDEELNLGRYRDREQRVVPLDVDPRVLRKCGIDPDIYSGFAFGLGLDRVAMIRYGIPNIRLLFDNDERLLRQVTR